MKRMLAALAALILSATAADAQFVPQGARSHADPAVWVVRDADTTIYLFGTIHVLTGEDDWFRDEVKRAFDASSEVRLEAVMPDNGEQEAPLIRKYAIDPKRRLADRISPAMRARVGAALGDQLSPDALEHFEPWFIGMVLEVQAAERLGFTGENGAEATITQAAKAAAKPLTEMEGLETQLKMLHELPETLQVALVRESLDEGDDLAKDLPEMRAAWASGDTERLGRLLNDETAKDPELYKLLLRDRNARWSDWIAARMARPGSVFIAVGAGHLAGRDSVQTMLAKKGLVVTRLQ